MSEPETLRHRTRGSRLLALLFVLFVSGPLLVAPATAACASDCVMSQVDPSDVGEPECVACSPVPAHAVLPDSGAEPLAGGPAPAMIDHIPQPPRRPPRT